MEKEPITIQGLEKLKEELIFLKEKKRPEIVSAISEARSHGDLKEMQNIMQPKSSNLTMKEELSKLMTLLLERTLSILKN